MRARSGSRYLSRALSFIRSRSDEQVEFTRELCNQNSYTFNKKGTDRVAGMVLERLAGALPHHRRLRRSDVGDHHVLRSGACGTSVHLVGHLDTVFPPDHPFRTCRRRGDLLAGPGTADMKGGLAVMVYALLALRHAGLLERLAVTLVLNSDEETGSATSRPVFLRERRRAVACLVAESAGAAGEVVTSRHGKMGARIVSRGRDRHVGAVSAPKASAVVEMAHLVLALESLNGLRPGVRVNVGRVAGGLGPGTVPSRAEADIDLRWPSERDGRSLRAAVRSALAGPRQRGCRSTLEVLNSRPAMPCHGASERLYRLAVRTAAGLGQGLGREHRPGTSDGNFYGAAGVPTLDGLGPVGWDDHTARERIRISTLAGRTALLAALVSRCGRSGEDFSAGEGREET